MNFLIDEQLPPLLADWLAARGHRAIHVRDIGLAGGSDTEVNAAAIEREAVLVTKDEDFAVQRRAMAARVLWIRFGNTRTRDLFPKLEGVMPAIEAAFAAGESLVEVR